MTKIKLEIKYERGHSYTEWWEKTDYFCPGCGKQAVWEEQGQGDYYMGNELLCLECEADFHLPTGAIPSKANWQNRQRIDALLVTARA